MKTVIDTSLLISLAKINYLETILHQREYKALPVGDAAVLALALQEKAMEIMTDDEGLSRIALSLGFKVRASPDLLLQAFKERVIDFQEFEKYVKGLILENRLGPVVAELYLMEGKEYVKE